MSRKLAIVLVFLMVSMISIGPTGIANPESLKNRNSNTMNTADDITARILIDESHCATNTELWTPANASRFGSFMMSYGHTVITNFDEPLDSGILDTFDIFMLFFPQIELTASEVQAVEDFVDNGGHLLLVGVDHRPSVSNYTAQPLNAISENYGITFNDDAYSGRSYRSRDVFATHHLLYSVESGVPGAGNFLQACSLTVESPAIPILTAIVSGVEYVGIAATEVGDSKIVAVSGAGPFLELGGHSWLVNQDDHHQFILNMLDWMLGNPEREVEIPDEYVMTVGNGPDLNSTEIEEYQMFVGLIHDHTTYSDGRSSAEQMTRAALDAQLDFMVMTDHSWENPSEVGIHGALKCKEYVTDYELDLLLVVGAELSNGPHVLGFPLTENIWSGDMHEKVASVHAQGGIALLCHPLLGEGYIEPWTNYDEYGYDGFEVINDVFMYGEGDSAYFRPFYAASDTHDAKRVGITLTAIFVKNPSGPNGTLAQDDIADAIRNRTVVGLCDPLHAIIGESVWVNRYLDLRNQAEAAIQDAEETIDTAISGGASGILAMAYLSDAVTALEYMNPSAALSKAAMASSDYILGIDIIVENGGFGLVDPYQEASATISVINNLDSEINLRIVPAFPVGIDLDQTSVTLEADAEDSGSVALTGTVTRYGYAGAFLNIRDYNSPEPIDPILYFAGGFIANSTVASEQVDGGYNALFQVFYSSGDTRYISSVNITYNDGNEETTATMTNLGDRYGIELGPFPAGTNITYVITVADKMGNSFVFDEASVLLGEGGLPLDSGVLLIIAGVGIGIVALVVVFVKIRK